jgi:serine/threonine protein kinase
MTSAGLIGKKLGAYHLEAILGQGGMATVYRARTAAGQTVALKTFLPPTGLGQELISRFEREARLAAKLNHPAIVPVLDVGQAQDYTFMVMAFIAGETLAERLLAVGKLDESTAIDIAWQIADALHYAHSHNIIHRDVKPSNILLTPDNRAMLSDFGVALALDDPVLTRTGYIVGTPAYIAPEQAAGKRPIDGRADLYALGVVLFQMLTGHIPFQGSTPELLHAHVYDPPPVPSSLVTISPAGEAIILRALAKDAARRFQTGLEMAQALANLGQHPPTRTHFSALETKTYPGRNQPPTSGPTTPHLQRSLSGAENPFYYGGAVAPDRFYGRRELVQTIFQRISAHPPQSISIVGERRMGKSSLLNFLKNHADQYLTEGIVIYLDLMRAYSRTRLGLMKALRRALAQVWREPWPASDDGDLMVFDFALEELQADGLRLLLCLDEVENLTVRAAEFNDVLEDWRACAQVGQLAIIAASAQPLADLCASGGLTSPFYNIFSQHRLPLLSGPEWRALVTDHLAATDEELALIEQVAGGHPFLTQMAASALWQARARGAVDQGRLYQEVWFEVQPHLSHLWRGLNPAEQALLQQSAAAETRLAPSHLSASLERRGLMAEGRPFSALFAEMIHSGQLD